MAPTPACAQFLTKCSEFGVENKPECSTLRCRGERLCFLCGEKAHGRVQGQRVSFAIDSVIHTA